MVDCCSQPGLLPFEQALENMLAVIKPVSEVEPVDIHLAVNRVLATDVTSPINVPGHDNSAMDGYAFALSSLQDGNTLTLAGRSMAGAPFQGQCLPGQCIRIMTGAKMPAGCDTVEMQENCQANGEHIAILSSPNKAANVRFAGEDIAAHSLVFSKGRKLSVVDIGVLASLGVKQVDLFRKLKVALIATGDELKLPGQALSAGDIFESNSYVLAALLTKLNIEVINFGIIPDDEDAIRAAFSNADQQADAVISSGGVSVGDADYTKLVLEQLGDVEFWKIAMKPGKPFAFGKLANSYFFGLPGNPVSALVTAHLLAVPALIKLQHSDQERAVTLAAKTTTALKKKPGRVDFQRGILAPNSQGEMEVTTTGNQGSGMLTSMAKANCYIVLPANQGQVPAGDRVTVRLFDQYVD